jgi:inorganic pyrophosphatase
MCFGHMRPICLYPRPKKTVDMLSNNSDTIDGKNNAIVETAKKTLSDNLPNSTNRSPVHRHHLRVINLPAWVHLRHTSSSVSEDIAQDRTMIVDPFGHDDHFEKLLNVVVEIPSGQTAKIEYDPECHKWQMDRVVDYLAYPCNYGFVPSTLAGDGDPLDVLLLGNAIGSGAVVHARPVAIMRMMDGGEHDDKIIAVSPHGMSYMADVVNDLDDLDKHYPGVTDVLRLWFTNYKCKPGHVSILGFEGVDAAKASILEAEQSFVST